MLVRLDTPQSGTTRPWIYQLAAKVGHVPKVRKEVHSSQSDGSESLVIAAKLICPGKVGRLTSVPNTGDRVRKHLCCLWDIPDQNDDGSCKGRNGHDGVDGKAVLSSVTPSCQRVCRHDADGRQRSGDVVNL